jgi:hypothetical protein
MDGKLEDEEEEMSYGNVPQDQIMQLETENQELLSKLESTLDHVRYIFMPFILCCITLSFTSMIAIHSY